MGCHLDLPLTTPQQRSMHVGHLGFKSTIVVSGRSPNRDTEKTTCPNFRRGKRMPSRSPLKPRLERSSPPSQQRLRGVIRALRARACRTATARNANSKVIHRRSFRPNLPKSRGITTRTVSQQLRIQPWINSSLVLPHQTVPNSLLC